MNATDPSGYRSFKQEFGRVLMDIAPLFNFIPFCQVWCAAIATAVGGYLYHGDTSAAVKAGMVSAMGSAVGLAAAGIGNATGNLFMKGLISGIAGGMMSTAGGGRFGDGFLGGMAGGLLGGPSGTGNIATDMIIGAIVGGSVSVIGGGKFKNGAVSGAFAAAVRSLGGKTQGASSPGSPQSGAEASAEDVAALKAELAALAADGTLDHTRGFETPDAAATQVLDATAPLSRKYGLEVGGNIQQGKDGLYRYTSPVVGTESSVVISANSIGYHTHPNGQTQFSNLTSRIPGGGVDSEWVKQNGKPLYMGTQMQNGHVHIAVCELNNCSSIGFGGTQGRVIK